MRRIRDDDENTVRNTASKPNDQLPKSNTGKEAAVIDQQAWQRKNNNKRNRMKKNNNTQVLNAGVSSTKDDHEIFIEASLEVGISFGTQLRGWKRSLSTPILRLRGNDEALSIVLLKLLELLDQSRLQGHQ
ncbi:hypothetical protein IFM89_025796 [Coptis chinensis]|uniref:Uncharacterized protein n=1 Tax=Coptis chinensis TaxID=261450 RepID=A0A835LNT2_9MAGN|nr:hypothetical protein IFM89_025796 [Coptis chinensis]